MGIFLLFRIPQAQLLRLGLGSISVSLWFSSLMSILFCSQAVLAGWFVRKTHHIGVFRLRLTWVRLIACDGSTVLVEKNSSASKHRCLALVKVDQAQVPHNDLPRGRRNNVEEKRFSNFRSCRFLSSRYSKIYRDVKRLGIKIKTQTWPTHIPTPKPNSNLTNTSPTLTQP